MSTTEETLIYEIERVDDLIQIYKKLPIESGFFGFSHLSYDVQTAKRALALGLEPEMLECIALLHEAE